VHFIIKITEFRNCLPVLAYLTTLLQLYMLYEVEW